MSNISLGIDHLEKLKGKEWLANKLSWDLDSVKELGMYFTNLENDISTYLRYHQQQPSNLHADTQRECYRLRSRSYALGHLMRVIHDSYPDSDEISMPPTVLQAFTILMQQVKSLKSSSSSSLNEYKYNFQEQTLKIKALNTAMENFESNLWDAFNLSAEYVTIGIADNLFVIENYFLN